MRVSIFDVCDPDGRFVFRAEDSLDTIMPERDDAYEEAIEALYIVGHAFVGGGAAPEVMLVQTGTDTDREGAALRAAIASRSLWAIRRHGPTPLRRQDIVLALAQAEDNGCRLRLRDLAAADEADVVHDVMGICANRDRVTGAVDLAVFRPRFLVVDGPAAAPADAEPVCGTSRAADRARIGRSRMDLHRSRLSLEALAADVVLPWRVDGTDTPDNGIIVIRDAEGSYVCELDLSEFEQQPFGIESEDRALRQARDVAQLICAAVLGKAPNEALDRDLAEAVAEAAAETVGASHG